MRVRWRLILAVERAAPDGAARSHHQQDQEADELSQVIKKRLVVLIPPGEVHVKLCPNEKMVDVSRLSNVHGCVGLDKSFQS